MAETRPPFDPMFAEHNRILGEGGLDNLAIPYAQQLDRERGAAALDAVRARVQQEGGGVSPDAGAEAGATPAVSGAAPADQPGLARRVAGGAAAVAGDVGRGLIESPGQAVAGVAAGVNETLESIDHLLDWLDRNTGFVLSAGADLSGLEPPELPEGAAPDSITGGLVRGFAQFMVGWLGPGKFFKAGKQANTGRRIMQDAVRGSVADMAAFDEQESRLADLWQEMGLPDNVLTGYLAADPDDGEAEAKLKQAIEGAGIGVAVDGLVAGIRLVRAVRRERGAGQAIEGAGIGVAVDGLVAGIRLVRAVRRERGAGGDLMAEQAERWGRLSDEDIGVLLGEKPDAPLVRVGDRLEQSAEAVAEGMPAGGREIFINQARINTPEDVKAVLVRTAEAFADDIDEARRGVRSHEVTQQVADNLGMSVADVLARRNGQPFNAEEAVAARRVWAATAAQLLAAAERATGPNAGSVDLYAFRRALAVHHAVQSQVLGARAETARALNAWAIPAGGNTEAARQVQLALDAYGGAGDAQDLARRLTILAKNGGDAGAIFRFTEKAAMARTADVVRAVWINGLLSSPKTHAVNILSNTGVALQQIVERAGARGIANMDEAFGGPGGVTPGEAIAMAHGLIGSLGDAFRLAAKALRTGVATGPTKIELPARNLSAEVEASFGAGRFGHFVGATVNAPGRLLMAEDEFFKTIGYRMEVRAQAVRQATGEGLEGDALRGRIAELVADPPENIRLSAADAALYNTFTNSLGRPGQLALKLRESVWGGWLAVPFLRTPANIVRYSFERTPFAPLVGQWRADIAAGGARRQIALARVATGSAVMAMALDWAASGQVTGRRPPGAEGENWDRLGIQEYSIRVGDQWYSFNRADPFGITMGFAADVQSMIRRGEIADDDADEWQELTAMAIAAVGQVTLNKTWMQGFADLVEVASDPERHSESYVTDLVASFVPFSSLMRTVETAVDPTRRDVNSPWEAIESRMAVLSERLTPRRDLWGETIVIESDQGRFHDFFSPIAARTMEDSPIDRELLRIGYYPGRINKRTSWSAGSAGAVTVDFTRWPEVYGEYVRLAGNGANPAWGGLGARDFLDQVVTGNSAFSPLYELRTDGPDGGKADFVRETIQTARANARRAIWNDPRFGDFRGYVEELQAQAAGTWDPALLGAPPRVPRQLPNFAR